MATRVRILICDDHEIFRKGFHVLLRKQSDIKIIGEAENGKELLNQVKKHQPDVVITDIQMPVMDGIQAARKINASYPAIGIIALTMFNDDHLIIDMLDSGARGYLLKNTTCSELVEAVQSVHQGGNYFCNATSKKLTKLIAFSNFADSTFKNLPHLSQTEVDIMRLICQEHSSKQIASILGYTTRTVENYREKIQEKIGAKNAVGVAVFAIKHKIYEP